MSARRTERLVNLVFCLLSTRRYLTAEQIRELVPGYAQSGDEAFARMFERDKEELREIGIPLETGTNSAMDDVVGYRIARRDYELPDIHLEPDEAAAVGLATRLWQSAQLAEAAGQARLKLAALGGESDLGAFRGLEPHVQADPVLPDLLTAVGARQVVGFDYITSGRSDPEKRVVEPWAVLSWHGHWYVVGYDRDRADARVFRLSRIRGAIRKQGEPGSYELPADFDPKTYLASIAGETGPVSAQLKVRSGTAYDLRRLAATPTRIDDEWEELRVSYTDVERLADQIAGYAGDVVVLEPPEARGAVIARLEAAAEAV